MFRDKVSTPAGITLLLPHPDINSKIITSKSYRDNPEEEVIDYSEEEVEETFNYREEEEEEDLEIILEQDPSFDTQGNAISELEIYYYIQ